MKPVLRRPPAVSTVRQHSLEWKQPAAVAFIAFLVAFARMPDRIIHGFLWAEDGKVFLQQAYTLGGASVLKGYAGYLELMPRLIAFIFSKIGKIDQSPHPFVWISVIVLCLTCAYLFTFARKIMPLTAAWVFGLAPIFAPNTGEVWLTITNLQWVIAPALLVLLWEEVRSPATYIARPIGKLVRGTAIVVMTLTGPFGVLYLPIVGSRLLLSRGTHRSRGTWITITAYLIAVGIQLIVIGLSSPREPAADLPKRVSSLAYLHFPWVTQFFHHMILDLVIPTAWSNLLGECWPFAALIVAIAMATSFLFIGRARWLMCLVIVALAVSLWAMSVVRTGTPTVDLKWDIYGGRYFYIPFVLMIWALLLSLVTSPYSFVRFVTGALLTLIAINSISGFKSQVWAPPSKLYSEASNTWQLVIPPGADWSVNLDPAQVGK